MNFHIRFVILVFMFFVIHSRNSAQVTAVNTAEFQIGKSNDNLTSRTGWYDQFNINYSADPLNFGFRLEHYASSENESGYSSLSQRYIEIRKDAFRVRVGNFFSIFGNGISQRSFDLPGVILEDLGSFSRYTPTRDLDGIFLEYYFSSSQITLLRGTPVESTLSPSSNFDLLSQNDRRSGIIEGIEIDYGFFDFLDLATSYLHLIPDKDNGVENELFTFSMNLKSNFFNSIHKITDLYIDFEGELSNRDRNILTDGLRASANNPHALYLALNMDYKNLSLSSEFKDYHSYNLGVNDPPSLVKEHSYVLLNRDTHVLLPQDERGYQIELSYFYSEYTTLSTNFSFARNNIFLYNTDFSERFFEVSHSFTDKLKGTFYFVNSKDELNSITDKVTFGSSWDFILALNTSTTLDIAMQEAERDFEFYLDKDNVLRRLEISKYRNLYMSLSFGKSGLYSAGFLTERSTDQLDTDRRSTLDIIETSARWWTSVNLSFELGMKHHVRIFAGKRRGGPACTAGTCYQLLPFEGLEINITSRL